MDTALKIKHHSLTGRIDLLLMHEAFRAVKRNKGKAGVDRVSIELFAQQLEQNLIALMRDLKQGTFQPLPVLRKYIDKGGGKLRPLGIPTVRDSSTGSATPTAQSVIRNRVSRQLTWLQAGTILSLGDGEAIGHLEERPSACARRRHLWIFR